MECRLETISPKRAQEYLKLNTFNRPVRQAHVVKLAEAMKRGEWQVTGDTIKMNGSILIDGQHRLLAIAMAGVSVQSYVARGVQKEAYNCIDQGATRNYGDHLGRAGEKHYHATAAAIRFIHGYTTGMFRRPHSNQQGDAVLEAHPKLRESVQLLQDLRSGKGLIGPGPAAGLHCLMAKKNKELADKFWTGVMTGEGLDRSMPEYQLRKRMLENDASRQRLTAIALYAFVIKAWNACRAGEALKLLRWSPDEAFPVIK